MVVWQKMYTNQNLLKAPVAIPVQDSTGLPWLFYQPQR